MAIKTTANPNEVGEKQSEDIKKWYTEVFDDSQRLAFLLGRISAMLDIGNAMSGSINEAIANEEKIYSEIRSRIQKDHDNSVKAKKKRTIKKEVKKNEK